MKKLIFLFLFSILYANNDVAIDSSIKIYEMPFGKALDMTEKDLSVLGNSIPLFKKKWEEQGSNERINNKEIVVIFKNKRNNEEKFNILVEALFKFGNENISNIDSVRFKKIIQLLKYNDLYKEKTYNNNFSLDTKYSNEINFSKMNAQNLVKYFIDNYFEINSYSKPNNDIRKKLVNELRKKLDGNSFINSNSIKYNIQLKELSKLYKILIL